MKFAICNETFWRGDFEETCAAAARHGYTGLEIAPFTLGSVESMSLDDARRVGATVKQHGLEIVGFHWLLARTVGYHLTDPDSEISGRTFDHAKHLAAMCGAMGGRIMVWGSPQQRSLAEDWNRESAEERVVDFFRRLSPFLEEADVTVALEFLGPKETNFLNTAKETVRLLERIDSQNVRLHLDVKAMAADPEHSITEIVRESLPWTVHFHANDPNLLGPGMGEVNFNAIASELKAGGYDGWVSVEVFDLKIGADAIARTSITNLRTAFGI
jgi:sugar phosphate isomerase/epimerase